jgi:Outer membrane lipoprotein-sorting protein
MIIPVFFSEGTPGIRARIQNSKAPEGWRTPGRSALNEGVIQRPGVLDCGGPPPLFRWAAMAVIILFFAAGAMAVPTNELSDAQIQGCNLARELYWARPETNFIQTGILRIRNGKGENSEFPFELEIEVGPTNWNSFYTVIFTNKADKICELFIEHVNNQRNSYGFRGSKGTIMSPFFDSDFWVADLGLEFFHWPEQKILKHEMRRGRACKVLESTNPAPSTNSYSRVVSWIDNESGGIVQAEAYDSKNKLLKEFAPKSFKKVNGRWELQEMEIRNVQTGSRTRLEFDLEKE